MELRQESLFADETKGGIEVIYSKFIDQRRMDYKALFGGFDHLRVITFSYGLGFVETVADMFEDVEIIIGSMNTVRPDIVDVAMHQKLEMKRLSKRKHLVERVKDGSVRIYFNMRKMSHEKLYILSADDGRCRIITGSANLSKRAFTGGQYEEITCFDGDAVMFDNRLARFESLKGMSSTTPLEPAAMVDFASVAGDSEGELESVPVMRGKGVVYLCDMPEDDDEVETFYTFDPKDMTEEEREQYAAMREHKVDYKPVAGGRVIIPDEVRRVISAAREAKAEREVRAIAYPKFHYDTESGTATLNGEVYEVQPEGAWVDDAHRISDIMRGYDSFIGDVEVTKQQFFKDACSALRRVPGTRSSKLTAFKKVIDGTVFVEQRRIPFQLPEGAECGRCERPLRASSASGERVALAASETVPAGTVLEFSILVMNPKDAETVREWLDYGALRGLFQWRNSGKGRFEWEEVAKED